jgi:hypothetical protein
LGLVISDEEEKFYNIATRVSEGPLNTLLQMKLEFVHAADVAPFDVRNFDLKSKLQNRFYRLMAQSSVGNCKVMAG